MTSATVACPASLMTSTEISFDRGETPV